ncbi:hypothetical protein SAMN05192555_106179 [Franzmannia pantelleriensis]|uniref:DUF1289 domain-containing protein n=1 Tax=Franzmannia pantelleriensis TaxID=48727 RepID=A0A1G9MDB0_9GAMM|nr:DUF1289 domain-containing protein [Halomonas pantelleriensis]SDL71665.1 hypothetical protein SAMN05192555_106179 [Halomonas pantelleriensis]
MSQRIVSPCVGLCSTTVGDTTCRGCQRHDREIRDWLGYDGSEREARMQALDALRVTVAERYLMITDAALLETQLVRYRIRFRPEQPALSRAIELLRVGRQRINDLTRYGLAPRDAVAALDPVELYTVIHRALDAAAQARSDAEP